MKRCRKSYGAGRYLRGMNPPRLLAEGTEINSGVAEEQEEEEEEEEADVAGVDIVEVDIGGEAEDSTAGGNNLRSAMSMRGNPGIYPSNELIIEETVL